MKKISYLIKRFYRVCIDEGFLTAIKKIYFYFVSLIRRTVTKINSKCNYQVWIWLYDRLGKVEQKNIKAISKDFGCSPLISVVMPVYNTPEKWLRLAIESVQNQLYQNWELCIADDASTSLDVKQVLQRYSALDSRIKVVFRESNGHISAASNSALDLVTGDYVAFLDHDDELTQNALFCVVEKLNKNPELDVIYSDEDKINENGVRYDPHFKSDWNPDLFYSQNYLCHLAVYKTELIKRIGGFRVGYEGSQDYDLAIRCIALTTPEKIGHIPRVLYHWRAIKGSTAKVIGEKDYASGAGLAALKDYFSQVDPKISVENGLQPTTYRVRYPLPDPLPKVSLIIPTRNAHELVKGCIDSILEKTDYPNYEIILVDNQSDDPVSLAYFSELQKHEKVTVLKFDAPFNYSSINNFAVRHASGEIIGLINNDIEVIEPEWLSEMVSHAVRKDIGVVGAKLLYTNGRVQHAGVILGLGGSAGHSHKNYQRDDFGYFSRLCLIQNYSAVTAACILVRKEIYQQVGGLDEVLFKVAFNDVDFCLKVREAGFRNLWTPYALLFHHESATRGAEDTLEKMLRAQAEIKEMQSRWGDVLESDPFYNPNLTIEHENFAIAFPPRLS